MWGASQVGVYHINPVGGLAVWNSELGLPATVGDILPDARQPAHAAAHAAAAPGAAAPPQLHAERGTPQLTVQLWQRPQGGTCQPTPPAPAPPGLGPSERGWGEPTTEVPAAPHPSDQLLGCAVVSLAALPLLGEVSGYFPLVHYNEEVGR
jgi:hypothetical protein